MILYSSFFGISFSVDHIANLSNRYCDFVNLNMPFINFSLEKLLYAEAIVTCIVSIIL